MKLAIYKAYETHVKKRNTFRYLSEYEKTQWLPFAELEKLRFERLIKLLQEAYDNVPYYNRTWKKLDISPQDIKKSSDISRLPLITKEIIRECPSDFINARYLGSKDLIKKTTGGSTGSPLEFYLSRESNERRVAIMHRGYAASGYSLGSKSLFLWAMPKNPKFRAMIKDRSFHWAHNRKMLNIFDIESKGIKYYIDYIQKHQPDVIVSYTTPIYMLSKYIVDNSIKMPAVKTIITAAENLYQHQRDAIQAAFGCSVKNSYGSREFMLMAFECEHSALHINMDHLYVEVVDENSNTVYGQSGDIVVTDLYNYGMPFIRYVNGDIGVVESKSCACGRGLDEQFTEIQGRKADIIYTQNRQPLTGLFFVYVFLFHPDVVEFQVIQNAYDSLDLNIVLKPGGKINEEKLLTDIRNTLGADMQIRLHYVERIERNKTGKLRVTISNIQ